MKRADYFLNEQSSATVQSEKSYFQLLTPFFLPVFWLGGGCLFLSSGHIDPYIFVKEGF